MQRRLLGLPKLCHWLSHSQRSMCSSGGGAISEVHVNWKRKDGSILKTPVRVGGNFLRQAQRHDIELEGACEGVCACSTCHVIFEDDVYDALPEPTEDEDDMLDQAFGLTANSRLGCQCIITPEHEGITITIPKMTRNFYVDGHVPKPH